MQITKRVKNCNGCAACVVACKNVCVKMHNRSEVKDIIKDTQPTEGKKLVPITNEDGCQKCNACVLFCPLFNPVELPEFDTFYEYDESLDERNMPAHYRQTMRSVRAGVRTEFVGTLCEIAALKSLLGDVIPECLILRPVFCDDEKRSKEPVCLECKFYKDLENK